MQIFKNMLHRILHVLKLERCMLFCLFSFASWTSAPVTHRHDNGGFYSATGNCLHIQVRWLDNLC